MDTYTSQEYYAELQRLKREEGQGRPIRKSVWLTVFCVALALVAVLLMFGIGTVTGKEMEPAFENGSSALLLKHGKIERGDIIAFRASDGILFRRVIATEGEWVNFDGSGNVYINNEMLEEPYLKEKAYGDSDIVLPYQVPDGCYFVLGDERRIVNDSRSQAVGCIGRSDVIGKVIYKLK